MLSPVQLLMSRRTRTVLPIAKSLLSPATLLDTRANRRQRQIKQAALSNRNARNLPPLQNGEMIPVKPTALGQKRWARGTIITGTNQSYDVQMDTGNVIRRNRVDLRPALPELDWVWVCVCSNS